MDQGKKEKARASNVKLTDKSLHSHASWLYSTVAALAIKEALADTVPYIINPPTDPAVRRLVYVFRLLAFLLLLIRFYLDHSVFFERAHSGEASDLFPSKSYVLDFLVGLVHFILFFVCAFSIDLTKRPDNLFFWMLFTILCWDVAWFLACLLFDTLELVKLRTVVNFVTAVLIFIVHWVTYEPALKAVGRAAQPPQVVSDLIVNAIVIFISIIALYDRMTNRKIFETVHKWLGPKEQAQKDAGAVQPPPQFM
ncbi:MAG: hypothetical protein QOH49_410 [Acidobacteriota bacterium]|jgi:hypothetical protein|nr:hypothetical protein [Acidobacteriota bacterium]